MNKPRNLFIVAMLAVSLLLAACGQPGSEAQRPSPDGFITVTVGLDSPSFSTLSSEQEFTALGVPVNEDGSIAVKEVRVQVIGNYVAGEQKPLKFTYDNNTYTYDPVGSVEYITLGSNSTPGESASHQASLVLPAWLGPFNFESHGYAESAAAADNASPIAYDHQGRVAFDGPNPSVWISLKSVLGTAEIKPRLPITMLTPGQSVDLMLYVYANDHPNLRVPLSDFALGTFDISGAEIGSLSNRGIRMDVHTTCSDGVSLTGEIIGLVYDADDTGGFIEGIIEVNTDSVSDLSCPDLSDGGVAADMEAPVLSFERDLHRVKITATDNYGIAAIQVFDGPDLVASTTASELSEDVVEIRYNWNTSAYEQINLRNVPSRGMTIYAFDASGNQTMVADGVTDNTMTKVYVSPEGTGTGESEASPLRSIQEAVDKVALGGTIYLLPGTYDLSDVDSVSGGNYVVDITGKHGITIQGTPGNSADVIIDVSVGAGVSRAHGIRLGGSNNVTLKDFTLIGPADGRAIHAQGQPSGTSAISGLQIRNVTIESADPDGKGTGYGITFTVARDMLIEGVNISGYGGVGGYGIRIKAAENITLRNTTVSGNFVGLGLHTVGPTEDYYFLKGVHNVITENFESLAKGTSSNTVALMTRVYDSYERSISGVDIKEFGVERTVRCGTGHSDTYYVYYSFDEGSELWAAFKSACNGVDPVVKRLPQAP